MTEYILNSETVFDPKTGISMPYYKVCPCTLCKKINDLMENVSEVILYHVWADPRREYAESEEDFLTRIPDGFITWPKEHIF